jgi:hypothetical protein
MKRLKLALSVLLLAALSFLPAPAQQVSIQVIAQQLAASMQNIASIQNSAAINTYNQDVAFYQKVYGTSPASTAPAPPAPPMLTKVDTALVIQLELQYNSNPASGEKIDWNSVYSQYQYTPPPPPPPAPVPITATVGTCYVTLHVCSVGSSSAAALLSDGASVVQNGTTYTFHKVQSPFGFSLSFSF